MGSLAVDEYWNKCSCRYDMMYAGYQGGVPECYHPLGGRGFDAQQAHSIMAPFVESIAVSILLILAAVVAG